MDITGQLNSNRRALDSQSASNWFNNINAFSAQRAQDEGLRSRDMQQAAQIAQMRDAQEARQLALDAEAQRSAEQQAAQRLAYFTQRSDVAAQRDAAAGQAALQRGYFDLAKEAQNVNLADKRDAVHNAGSANAYQFGESENAVAQALDKVKELTKQQQMLYSRASDPRMDLKIDAKSGRFSANRTELQHVANAVNDQLGQLDQARYDAAREAKMLQSQHEKLMFRLDNQGFSVGPDKTLIFKKTGTPFRYGAASNVTINPVTGRQVVNMDISHAPAMSQAPIETNVPSAGYFSVSEQGSAPVAQSVPMAASDYFTVNQDPNVVAMRSGPSAPTVGYGAPSQSVQPLDQRFEPPPAPENLGASYLGRALNFVDQWLESDEDTAKRRLEVARQQFPNAKLIVSGAPGSRPDLGQPGGLKRPGRRGYFSDFAQVRYFIDTGGRNHFDYQPPQVQAPAPVTYFGQQSTNGPARPRFTIQRVN